MSTVLINAAPYAIDLLSECLNVCSAIMQHSQATMAIELQRESMHLDARTALQIEKKQHDLQMKKLEHLNEKFGITLHQNRQATVHTMQNYKLANENLQRALAYTFSSEATTEDKLILLPVIEMLGTQLSQLSKQHYDLASQATNAYLIGLDALHDGPRTFTHVK